MAESFVGQIIMTGFNFAPKGFALCNGQLLQVTQNQALFALLGVMYGGDGRTTFGLPDLRGRTPVGVGTSADVKWQPPAYTQGTPAGVENVTLSLTALPTHKHTANGSAVSAVVRTAAGNFYSTSNLSSNPLYAPATGPQIVMDPTTIGTAGGNVAHNNMQPFQVLNFCICLAGYFPSRG